MFMRGRVTEAWQVYYQKQNRMIERDVASAFLRRFESFTRTGLFRAVWTRTLEVGFPAEFQEYVESQMNEAGDRARS